MEPSYRASLMQAQLKAVFALPEGVGERVRERMPSEAIRRIQNAGASDWIPVSFCDPLGSSLYAEVGEKESIQFWRGFVRTVSSNPLFDSLIKRVLKFVGSPLGMLQIMPHAWPVTSRGMGNMDLVSYPGENRAILMLNDIPKISRTQAVVTSVQGSCMGALDLVNCEGDVGLDQFKLDQGSVSYIVLWRD